MGAFFTFSMLFCSIFIISYLTVSLAGDLTKDFEITWGNARISNAGQLLTLSLDKYSGSGFRSRNEYLFGRIDMQLKLVAGNSAGTVTAYYLTSTGTEHDEIDFEFLGNVTGEPYILHTNVFSQGKGNREEQFHLWFDPTKNFHTYSLVWNSQRIIFLVDNNPIRVFTNMESRGVPYPKTKPMRIHSSLWNADDWATQGGRVPTNWTNAPFRAYYRNFNAQACIYSNGTSSCPSATGIDQRWQTHDLDANGRRRLRWAQMYYRIYNYCRDTARFPQGMPTECTRG